MWHQSMSNICDGEDEVYDDLKINKIQFHKNHPYKNIFQ